MGLGTNNFVEWNALLLVMKTSLEKDLTQQQVFGDSKLIIDWLHYRKKICNIFIIPTFDGICHILGAYEAISFNHIYRLRNVDVDHLSKSSLQLAEDSVTLWEQHKDIIKEIDHGPISI